MTTQEYIEAALKTKSSGYNPPSEHETSAVDTLHGAIGIVTEGGEILDSVKKTIFYGANFDYTNLREELGDLLWYIAIICNAQGYSFEGLMEMNINKLKTRYPDKFATDKALNRDLELERKILEQFAEDNYPSPNNK